MPSVNIKEIDKTTANDVSYYDYTVFIPGIEGDGGTQSSSSIVEYSKLTDFEAAIKKPASGTEATISYNMASKLLDLGIHVLFGVVDDTTFPLDTGGIATTLYKKLEDKGVYDIRFVTCGGYANQLLAKLAIKCAAERGDAVAILDPAAGYVEGGTIAATGACTLSDEFNLAFPTIVSLSITTNGKGLVHYDGEASGTKATIIDSSTFAGFYFTATAAVTIAAGSNTTVYPIIELASGNSIVGTSEAYLKLETIPTGKPNSVDTIEAYVSSIPAVAVTRSDGTVEDGMKYASIFAPGATLSDTTSMPASFIYLNCFAYYISRYPEWFAMAGSTRGVSPNVIKSVGVDFGDADNAILQAREVNTANGITASHRACNTISKIRPYDYILWGNRTMYPLGSGLVASSFLNIRQLCCTLKKVMYRAARKYTFEPNSDVLWTNFVNAITPTLEEMKSGQGIRGYKITQETTNEKATLKARVRIIPIEAVEDFDLTVELTDSIETSEEEA